MAHKFALTILGLIAFNTLLLSQKRPVYLPDHFAREKRPRTLSFLASPFSTERTKKSPLSLSPSAFLRTKKSLSLQPSADHFSFQTPKRQLSLSKSHFGTKPKKDPLSHSELKYTAKKRKKPIKFFVGERTKLFMRAPKDKEKKKRFRWKPKSPFGKRKKDLQRSSPRGENGLFQNGVMPKIRGA